MAIFGYQVKGPGDDRLVNYVWTNWYEVPEAWTPDSIIVYVKCAVPGQKLRAGIYDYISEVEPGALLAPTVEYDVPAGTDGWVELPIQEPKPVFSSGRVHLMVNGWGVAAAEDFRFYYTWDAVQKGVYMWWDSEAAPDFHGAELFYPSDLRVSMACSYTPVTGPPPTELMIYIYPAITDNRIVPTTSIGNQYLGDQISLRGSPGEYIPCSIVIKPPSLITLEAMATDLTGLGGTIPASSIDIRVVKCWYQAAPSDIWVGAGKVKYLTPELLVKDDSLVKIEGQENYLKVDANYIWISEVKELTTQEIVPIPDLPVVDTDTLQPVIIPGGENKQFWVTVHIPEGTLPGVYEGSINFTAGDNLWTVGLTVEVLPIQLLQSPLVHGLFYRGRLDTQGSISSESKNLQQMTAELHDMLEHETPAVTIYVSGANIAYLESILSLWVNVGMGNQSLYLLGFRDADSATIQQAISLASSYGFAPVYFYGFDEPTEAYLQPMRDFCDRVHAVGGKVFTGMNVVSVAQSLADVLDLALWLGRQNGAMVNLYHSYGHKIYAYGNPQVGVEKPLTYRRNYGLLLWQQNWDGAMDYAYQHSFGNIWNDFDHTTYRDHVFAYPTVNGVIDTIEWEGWREGVTDIRYLETLLDAIETGQAQGVDTAPAEQYLNNLKTANLSGLNLDSVRAEIIDHILYLQGEPVTPPPPPPVGAGGLAVVVGGALLGAIIIASRRKT